MNPYKGEFIVKVPDRATGALLSLTFVFDWTAISRMKAELGARSVVQLLTSTDPMSLAQLTVIGLAAKHPDITVERLFQMSPPLQPIVEAIEKALHFAYYGPGQVPIAQPASDKPTNPIVRMAMKLLPAWLWRSKSA